MNVLSTIAPPYSKLRNVHTNTLILDWIVMIFISAALFLVPRLCNTPLRFPALTYVAGWLWNLALVLDIVSIWAETPDSALLVDLMVVLSVVMVNHQRAHDDRA